MRARSHAAKARFLKFAEAGARNGKRSGGLKSTSLKKCGTLTLSKDAEACGLYECFLNVERGQGSLTFDPNHGPFDWAPSLESLYTHHIPYTKQGSIL